MALGFAVPVVAQNSVVRSSDFLDQDAVTVSSKVAAAYQKPVVAVAQIPTVTPVEASDSVEVYSMSNNDTPQPSSIPVVVDSDKPAPPAVVTDGPYRFYPYVQCAPSQGLPTSTRSDVAFGGGAARPGHGLRVYGLSSPLE